MVSFSDVTLNNESLKTPGSGPIAAFVGGTNGIGLSTLQALLKHTSSPTVYLVGRDSSRLNSLISEVQPLNTSATIIPIVANDLTLVRNAQKAAKEIASQAPRLDILVMSPGYLTFSSASFSPEGLDRLTAIRYHARMRFLVTLLPLLRLSPSPRVISVLAAGQEGPLNLSDLGMTGPKSQGPIYAAGAAASMITLAMEHLSKQPGNEKIVFIHTFPGIVADTGLKVHDIGFFMRFLINWIVKPVMKVVGITSAESGERTLFAATNGRFRRLQPGVSGEGTLIQEGSDGTQGSGVYALKADSSVVSGGGNASLKKLRNLDGGKKVWEYTLSEFERIESMDA